MTVLFSASANKSKGYAETSSSMFFAPNVPAARHLRRRCIRNETGRLAVLQQSC
jgi:hypothetical protein